MTATGEYSDVEYVFEPHVTTMPNLREYVEALWARRQFMARLAQSDLRNLRSSTALGSIWSVLDPLFQASIYFFLYAVLRGGKASQVAFLPIMIGSIFLFGLSTAALSEGGASIKRSKNLMLNSTFPRALLPVTSVYKSLRQFVPAACVFLVIFPLVGGTLGPGLFVLPLLFVLQIVMNVGIALSCLPTRSGWSRGNPSSRSSRAIRPFSPARCRAPAWSSRPCCGPRPCSCSAPASFSDASANSPFTFRNTENTRSTAWSIAQVARTTARTTAMDPHSWVPPNR
jgi:hypothetical protein